MQPARRMVAVSLACGFLFGAGGIQAASLRVQDVGWAYGAGDPQGTRYSALAQITPANVSHLRRAWIFHTGDVSDGSGGEHPSGFETTPLMLDGRLYLTTAFNRVIALDPASGRQLWSYDPKIDRHLSYGDGLSNRGLAAWRDPEHPSGQCALRLFEASPDARLLAVDAATGHPCVQFGRDGAVDLKAVSNYRPAWTT